MKPRVAKLRFVDARKQLPEDNDICLIYKTTGMTFNFHVAKWNAKKNRWQLYAGNREYPIDYNKYGRITWWAELNATELTKSLENIK